MFGSPRYLVQLPHFEGPLALLLYLIRKEEMDVFNINIHHITKQYLEHIRLMKELDLEVAGEFVAMAATLIHIKSRLLLPQYDEQGEVVETEDPRRELVQKLLDYQMYQEAAKNLYDRPLLNRDVWARGLREDLRSDEDGGIIIDIEQGENGLFGLIGAYRRAMRKADRLVHRVRPKTESIAGRVMMIKDRLIVGARVLLRDLLNIGEQPMRHQLLITFLSMLELGRLGFVSVFQNETYGDIHIEAKKQIERNVLERVQEFDAQDAEAVAASIIQEAAEQELLTGQTSLQVDLSGDAGDVAASPQQHFVDTVMAAASGDEPLPEHDASLEAARQAVAMELDQELEAELTEAERELGLDAVDGVAIGTASIDTVVNEPLVTDPLESLSELAGESLSPSSETSESPILPEVES